MSRRSRLSMSRQGAAFGALAREGESSGFPARAAAVVAALLSLAALAGLTLATAPARATYAGVNGKIACQGIRPLPGVAANFDIFTINPDGTDETVLTRDPAQDQDPAISPDARNIVFESSRAGVSSEAWRMGIDGSNPIRLTTNGNPEDRGANWTPDGQRIYFHSTRDRPPNTNWDIYVMNADGSNQTRLTDDPGQDTFPELSPDGTRILFNSNRTGDIEMYTMDTDGTDIRRLTNSPGQDTHGSWSPDGRYIAFQSARNPVNATTLRIYRMDADGGNVTLLSPASVNFNAFPDYSPDGRRVVFGAQNAADDPFDPGSVDVYHVDAATGGDLWRVTRTVGTDTRCDWGPAPRAAQPPPGSYPVPPATLAGCPPGRNVITLGAGNDVRNGTPGNDLIFAGAGNDVIDGLAGDDCLALGAGNDRGQGGLGNDLVVGDVGNDTVTGSAGNDRLRGDAGNDSVIGDIGNDEVFGGVGIDRLLGGLGDDRLEGNADRDTISGSRGRDRISGGAAGDRISGGSSADRIAGGAGNDRINGNSSNDSLRGNAGRDRISGSSGRDSISGGSGNDSISARDKTRDRVNCGTGRDRVVADRVDRVARNCERVSRRS